MPSPQDLTDSFQKVRAETWRAIRIWVLVLVPSTVAFFMLSRDEAENMAPLRFYSAMGVFLIIFASSLAILIKAWERYRCPGCGEVPMASWFTTGSTNFGWHSGVSFNPERCDHCGAILNNKKAK